MKIYIYAALLIGYVTGVGLFAMLGLGLDIHINDHYFVIGGASTGFLFVMMSLPTVILILLIRREMRRKRLAETSSQ
jgi:hypothetical protein